MFCTKCGSRVNNEKANFCKKCGNKLRKSATFTNNKSVSSSDLLNSARKKLLDFAKPKLEKTKEATVGTLDNWQKNLQDSSKFKNITDDQRSYLSKRLFALRNRISAYEDESSLSIDEAKEIVSISEELYEQVKKDKCMICLKPLEEISQNDMKLAVCPHCSHGGHKNHIYSWFESKGSCPYCKAKVETDEILILNL